MRTEAQERTLWLKLDGVTEFKHDNRNTPDFCIKCNQTLKDSKWELTYHGERTCPIPDEYPGSDSEIAEKIRLLMSDKCFNDQTGYYNAVESIIHDKRGARSVDGYILFYATPTDKITAFTSMFKEKE